MSTRWGEDQYHYGLMGLGLINGPNSHYECPAPISPGYKIDLNWVTPTTISKGSYDVDITAGNIYMIEIYNSDEYFVLERNIASGWSLYTPSSSAASLDGINIWHWDPNDLYDYAEIECADNVLTRFAYSSDRFPKPPLSTQDFTDYTTPSSRLRNGDLSDVAIENIRKIGTGTSGYGRVDVVDPTPQKPTGLNLSGSEGQHPTLSWTANGEPDINVYKIYRDDGNGWQYLNQVSSTTTQFTDTEITIGDQYDPEVCYTVTAVDLGSNESDYADDVCTTIGEINKSLAIIIKESKTPSEYALRNSYPNPFNPSTNISFQIPQKGHVVLKVFDTLGNEVTELVNEIREPGEYSVKFDGSNLASGVYIYTLRVNDFFTSSKMLLMK